MKAYDGYLDETHDFYDEGQSENRVSLPSPEDVFVGFMQHANFQHYTGLFGLGTEQIRAVFGIAEMARNEAASQRRHQVEAEGREDEDTVRVQRLCQALHEARHQVRSLTKTLQERNERIEALKTEVAKTRHARPRDSRVYLAARPAMPVTPIPTPPASSSGPTGG